MRPHLGIAAFIVFGFLAQACSSGDTPKPGGNEHLGETSQAITTACSLSTLGLPCDPDGPAKPRSECEGICWLGTTGLASCIAVKTGVMDGISCGTQAGVGDPACNHYCSGKTCLSAVAPAGAACRPPNAVGGICEGQCDGGGHCTAVAQPCAAGRNEQLCTVNFCDQRNATKCTVVNLAKNTLCSDADACSISSCNGSGVCVQGGTAGCDDGNACTDDTCDPDSGACLGQFNDANNCSDSNACTSGDFCQSGVCHSGTTKPDCDDHNPCTTDSCDPNVGCAHVPVTCSDGDACTADTCNPNTGACSNPPLSCDDSNLCTVDACSALTGCTNVPIACDDNNACTADSCAAGACLHDPISCADADACTDDTCVPASGCAHAPILDCGAGGTGGDSGVAGDGSGGADGNAGASGADTGGVAGTGGSDSVAGTGGSDSVAGTGGSDSVAGTGGSSPTPEAGTAGLPSAGSATAGSSTGGSPTAGSNSTAGTTPEPGASGEGGDGASGGNTHVVDSGGCSCRVVSAPRGTTGAWALTLLAGLSVLRRRKARRAA